MNKLVYVILTCIFTSIFLSSCVKEDGAGVPRAKSLFLEHSEYNVDLENQAKREVDLEKQRIRAARDIAVAYYKQHTNLILIF